MYSRDAEGRPQMVLLERAAYESAKTGGFAAYSLTHGIAKIKSKAVLPGRYAGIRTTDQNVVFYFYFDHKAELGESSFLHTVSNPSQFSLVKLAERKATRETLTGEFGIWSGMSTGTDEDARITFKSDKIRTGLYKVTPSVVLPNGEYCFLALGPDRAANIYDFGFGAGM
jgi:hypothetical protein